MVLMPHLGMVLQYNDWKAMADKLTKTGQEFVIAPTTRFEGQPDEQWTMFFFNPFDNPVEVKGFKNLDMVFDT